MKKYIIKTIEISLILNITAIIFLKSINSYNAISYLIGILVPSIYNFIIEK